jgi:hypothetical protein
MILRAAFEIYARICNFLTSKTVSELDVSVLWCTYIVSSYTKKENGDISLLINFNFSLFMQLTEYYIFNCLLCMCVSDFCWWHLMFIPSYVLMSLLDCYIFTRSCSKVSFWYCWSSLRTICLRWKLFSLNKFSYAEMVRRIQINVLVTFHEVA